MWADNLLGSEGSMQDGLSVCGARHDLSVRVDIDTLSRIEHTVLGSPRITGPENELYKV